MRRLILCATGFFGLFAVILLALNVSLLANSITGLAVSEENSDFTTLKIRGTDATYFQLVDDAVRGQVEDAVENANLNVLFMDAKVEDGTLAFQSGNPVALQLGVGEWAGEPPVSKLLELQEAAEVGGRFIVGKDEKYAAEFPEQAIEGSWVDIGCPAYQDYLADLISELAVTGIDHINLDFARFPDSSEVPNPVFPCSDPENKAGVIDGFVETLANSAKAANPEIVVSASVFGRVCYGINLDDGDPFIGQRVTIADYVDFVAPMLYPELMDPVYHDDPYTGVKDHTECFRRHIPKEKVVPWIQGFDKFADADSILTQIKGVEDGDGYGYLLWWMVSIAPDSDIWAEIKLLEELVIPEVSYDWHEDVSASVFWVGEEPKPKNYFEGKDSSFYDADWLDSFGGVDDPLKRSDYMPADFIPYENPFYASVPYADFDSDFNRKESAKDIPWYEEGVESGFSFMKNSWIEVRANDISCYAQVQDAGPFLTDDFDYVFNMAQPANEKNENAGLEISPAVHDCLGLEIGLPPETRESYGAEFPSRTWKVDWRFVGEHAVPEGPWKNVLTFSETNFDMPDFVDYPFNLVSDDKAVQVVVGDVVPSFHMIAAADIAGSLTAAGVSNEVKLASESSLDTSVITIGCNNITMEILNFDSEEECVDYTDSLESEAVILFRLKNGIPHVIILGKSELGIRMAARVLANYLEYNIASDTINVDGTSLDDIQVSYPGIVIPIQGRLDLEFELVENLSLDSFDETMWLNISFGGSNGTIILNWDFKELEDGSYEAFLTHPDASPREFRFKVEDGKVVITEFEFSVDNLDLNDWLLATDFAKGVLDFEFGTYGTLRAELKFKDFDDITHYPVFRNGKRIGDFVVEAEITDLGIPPFEIVKNTFYGDVNYSDGVPVSSGTVTGYLTGLTYEKEFFDGNYNGFVVKGSPGSYFKLFVNGRFIERVLLEDTDEPIRLDILIDDSSPAYGVNEQRLKDAAGAVYDKNLNLFVNSDDISWALETNSFRPGTNLLIEPFYFRDGVKFSQDLSFIKNNQDVRFYGIGQYAVSDSFEAKQAQFEELQNYAKLNNIAGIGFSSQAYSAYGPESNTVLIFT